MLREELVGLLLLEMGVAVGSECERLCFKTSSPSSSSKQVNDDRGKEPLRDKLDEVVVVTATGF